MGRFAFANMNAKVPFERGVAYWPKAQGRQPCTAAWGPRLAALPAGMEDPAAMIAIVNALFEVTSDRDLSSYEDDLERYLPFTSMTMSHMK